MMRALAVAGFMALLSAIAPDAAWCQPDAVKASFDIADIAIAAIESRRPRPISCRADILGGDRYEVRRATMLDLIKTAYNLDADKVYGGPGWLDYDRFGKLWRRPKPGRFSRKRCELMPPQPDCSSERFGSRWPEAGERRRCRAYTLSKGKGELKLKAVWQVGEIGCVSGVRVLEWAAGFPATESNAAIQVPRSRAWIRSP